MIIHVYVITLYMNSCGIKKFKDIDRFLACNNWLTLLKEIEKKY